MNLISYVYGAWTEIVAIELVYQTLIFVELFVNKLRN